MVKLSLIVFMALSQVNGNASLAYSSGSTVKVVNVIFRHGDRAPVLPLPKDNYNESFWPYGFGELTDQGKQQHFRLGTLFRDRYKGFLKETFDYKEIYVRSSDYDRCLISAYSNLAGLYSNGTGNVEPPFLNWQPIPVHSIPKELDELVAMGKPCNALSNQSQQIWNSDFVRQLDDEYKQFFSFVTQQTGVDLSKNGLENMWMVHDTLFCERAHNFRSPVWLNFTNMTCGNSKIVPCENKTVWDILTDLNDLQFTIQYNTSTIHRFNGGPLLEEVANNFYAYTNGSRTIKFNMYSGHDTTVAAVLSALNISNGKAPQYTSTVFIELHSGKEHDVVEVFVKNVTDNDTIYSVSLPGCPSPCSLDNFSKLISKYKITDWDVACNNTKTPSSGNWRTLTKDEVIIMSVCASLIGVMSFAALICYIRRKRISDSYIPIPNA